MIEPTVSTVAGRVRGLAIDGRRHFYGVPYAAPPVGSDRFEAPQPVVPWQGVRDATVAGANAPQRTKAFPGLDTVPLIGEGWVPGDNYLTVNVWAPNDAATASMPFDR